MASRKDYLEQVAGRFLIASVRVEGRVAGALGAYMGVDLERQALFDHLMRRINFGDKIATLKSVLEDSQLTDEYGWLPKDLHKIRERRNLFAHTTGPQHVIEVGVGEHESSASVVENPLVLHRRNIRGEVESISHDVDEWRDRLNKAGIALNEVRARLGRT